MEEKNILDTIKTIQIIDRDLLKANDYNPNMVLEENLKLLERSILNNGWTAPIVVTKDLVIIDGYHRWLVSGREPLKSLLNNKVPIVIVEHKSHKEDIYGTITHNRARGTHLLDPMKKIIKELIESNVPMQEISKELGMREEEIFRLSDFSREDFLKLMIKDYSHSKAKKITNINVMK
jgi:ParB-like chromosome segregation protein Spo0J